MTFNWQVKPGVSLYTERQNASVLHGNMIIRMLCSAIHIKVVIHICLIISLTGSWAWSAGWTSAAWEWRAEVGTSVYDSGWCGQPSCPENRAAPSSTAIN